MSVRHVVLSGCSGGGKSTLLVELERRGFMTVPEPGRRIVEEEQRGSGRALPWVDLAAFARRAIDLAAEDRKRIGDEAGWVFFDRGLVDAAVALQHATGHAAADVLQRYERYHRRVFLTPPWPEIFVNDGERQHGLAEAVAEYDRLLVAYGELRYEVIELPKVGVADRADSILSHLS
ncbi:AAA family ATPase [Aurantimonas sp. NFXS3]|uniref:AAA family ATPase n=1 Tax=Aurantimonas sp. NFXS3 TaxID=2818434 RepID=UPI003B8BF636